MKIRKGFVSNSSSSSFIIFVDEELKTKEDIKNYVGSNCNKYDINLYRKLRNTLNEINDLYRDKKINDKQKRLFQKLINKATYNNRKLFYWPEEDNEIDFSYTPSCKIIKSLYESIERNKEAELPFDESGWPLYEKRKLYKISNWKNLLKKDQYLYNVLYSNFYHTILYKDLFGDEFGNTYIKINNFDYITCKNNDNETLLKKLTEEMVASEIEIILDLNKDNIVYFIDYCTDDGESTFIDNVMRSYGEDVFGYCNYVIRHEKS